ncbi:unnamed protein product [Vitrella brassicaformis CCMP3155]|uniref:Acyltransferase n=1 Tax=Vitrella brassicaformis (strain CCMP3155) TaxID=1169540 RepID=A0A0G4GMX3_VITBC|nr:unnamed protein product [Vitrella brassicaformis CCMP3155]|mmetsp:Transcript_22644/g.55860  ORF Transcript_22644/g.55860 Transcript_22644/m.55860 type:complete len:328 (-) Transcript_22644:621-1604(-)|eukprot:CEM31480.1 unnamed protein product [Vitrella brassicaformis CCMP3155]
MFPLTAALFALFVANISVAFWLIYLWRTASHLTHLGDWGPDWLAHAVRWCVQRLYALGGLKFGGIVCVDEKSWDLDRQYVVSWHPHGVNAVLPSLIGPLRTIESTCKLRTKAVVGVASGIFYIPLLREMCLCWGARPADREILSMALKSGRTLFITPGGIYEQVHTDPTREQLYLPKRLRWIRLAIEHGVPLLPSYSFQETRAFSVPEWGMRLARYTFRMVRWPIMPLRGPNPVTITLGIGRALEVGEPDPNPSDEKVARVLATYLEHLHEVFETFKTQCLPPEVAKRGLVVHMRGHLTNTAVLPKHVNVIPAHTHEDSREKASELT